MGEWVDPDRTESNGFGRSWVALMTQGGGRRVIFRNRNGVRGWKAGGRRRRSGLKCEREMGTGGEVVGFLGGED